MSYTAKIAKAILGGLAICLGTIACKLCPYPWLAPLLFATGILMVMAFDWGLITRHIPTGKLLPLDTTIIIVLNLVIAYCFGLMFDLPLTIPDNLFVMSIAGGLVIGLVSFNNIFPTMYRVPLALLLMYIFVMLGLPHCVVYAFLNVDLGTLGIVLLGNIVGGLILRLAFSFTNKELFFKKKSE